MKGMVDKECLPSAALIVNLNPSLEHGPGGRFTPQVDQNWGLPTIRNCASVGSSRIVSSSARTGKGAELLYIEL